jgi:hypothetical protein
LLNRPPPVKVLVTPLDLSEAIPLQWKGKKERKIKESIKVNYEDKFTLLEGRDTHSTNSLHTGNTSFLSTLPAVPQADTVQL